jgi:hypothetical protein
LAAENRKPDVIDDELKSFLEADVAATVGTRSADLAPEVAYAWGPRVLGPREMHLFLDRAASERVVANLNDNRMMAATFANPITYAAVQLKGWCAEIGEAQPEDAPWVEKHRQGFMEALRARGLPAHVTRSLWSSDVIRIRFVVEESFEQTPGPGAGRKL